MARLCLLLRQLDGYPVDADRDLRRAARKVRCGMPPRTAQHRSSVSPALAWQRLLSRRSRRSLSPGARPNWRRRASIGLSPCGCRGSIGDPSACGDCLAQTSQVWSFVAGNASSRSLAVISRQVVVLLVGFIGGPAAAGIYRVASQIGFALLKLAQTLLFALYPALVRDPDNAHAVTGKVTRVAIIGALCAVTLAAAAGSHVLALIAGSEYSQAHWPIGRTYRGLGGGTGRGGVRGADGFARACAGGLSAPRRDARDRLFGPAVADAIDSRTDGRGAGSLFAALATLAALALASRRPVRELAA